MAPLKSLAVLLSLLLIPLLIEGCGGCGDTSTEGDGGEVDGQDPDGVAEEPEASGQEEEDGAPDYPGDDAAGEDIEEADGHGDPGTSWARTYGTASVYEIANDMEQTPDGGFVLAGKYAVFGGDLPDYWVVKVDAAGEIMWQKRYGGLGDDQAYSIEVLEDGGYFVSGVSGSFDGDTTCSWVLRLDADGGIAWQKAYVAKDAGVHEYTDAWVSKALRDGGFILAGHYIDAHEPGGVGFGAMRLDTDGGLVWNRVYQSDVSDYAYDVAEALDGGFAITGLTGGSGTIAVMKVDAGGEIQWQKEYPLSGVGWISEGNGIDATPDGGFIVTGYVTTTPPVYSFLIMKLDESGAVQWFRNHGDVGHQEGKCIALTTDGGFIAAGETLGLWTPLTAMLVMKTNGAGSIEWQGFYGGEFMDVPRSVMQALDGGYAVAGWTTSYGAGLQDSWVIRLRGDGTISEKCSSIVCDGCETSEWPIDLVALDTGMIVTQPEITIIDTDTVPADTDAVTMSQCFE